MASEELREAEERRFTQNVEECLSTIAACFCNHGHKWLDARDLAAELIMDRLRKTHNIALVDAGEVRPPCWIKVKEGGSEKVGNVTTINNGMEDIEVAYRNVLPAAPGQPQGETMPTDDDELTAVYMAGRYEGRREAAKDAVQVPADVWKQIIEALKRNRLDCDVAEAALAAARKVGVGL